MHKMQLVQRIVLIYVGMFVKQALFGNCSIIINFMRKSSELQQEQFTSKLLFQSMATVLPESQQLPLYKMSIRPYDYYVHFTFKGALSRLHFYQQLQSSSSLVVQPEYVSVQQIGGSYFERWFGFAEKNEFSISCYMRYYNYTIGNWIENQKKCASVISEQEILMVFRQLLAFHKIYQQYYRQPCGIFKAGLIYITPEKCLRIYPHSIDYNGQISVHKDRQSYLNLSLAKCDREGSIETTINNSRTHIELTNETESDDNSIHPDLRDIFILVMQLISLKKYEYFFSKKHSVIIWDAVNHQLSSFNTSHLSQEFVKFLEGCAMMKNFDSSSVLGEVERLISQKQRMCKTIHVEKNQQLAQLVLKKLQTEKIKNLQDLKVIAKSRIWQNR